MTCRRLATLCVSVLLVSASVTVSAATESSPCRPVDGVEKLLRPGNVVLLGEQHGTAESPRFALDLACHATKTGIAVRVGIEISNSEQARVDGFLASSGDPSSRRALLEGPPWQAAQQYGVTSEAMYGLFDGLRRLRQEDHDVEIVLFNKSGARGGQARDRAMAEYLAAAVEKSEGAVLIVLTGNIHSRVTIGTPWDSNYEPMGFVLTQMISPDAIISLDAAHTGGTAWLCIAGEEGCGPVGLRGRGPEGSGVTWNDSPDATGHHGWYRVGSITASPPARDTVTAEILWKFETDG